MSEQIDGALKTQLDDVAKSLLEQSESVALKLAELQKEQHVCV